MLTDALIVAEKIGQSNVLGFLRLMPGEQASIDLPQVADAANRLKTNLEKGVALVLATEATPVMSVLREHLLGGSSRGAAPFGRPPSATTVTTDCFETHWH